MGMEKQTGSKSGKEYVKAVYCHPAYLTYMQSPSAVILEPRKLKSLTVSIVSPSIYHKVMGPDVMMFGF